MMKKIIKYRYWILAIWLIITMLLTVFQPDTQAILQERGQNPISDSSPSKMAEALLTQMETQEGTSDLAVFYSADQFSPEEMKQIEKGVVNLRAHSQELGIIEIMDPFSMPEAKDNFISADGTTLMVPFTLDQGDVSIDDLSDKIKGDFAGVNTEYYLTGEDFINNDYLHASLAGIEKSAALTVLFILMILIIMFRSVVTPVISLVAVAITYLCSMGIAAQLIDKWNFPITTLTQVLLILILFGIGTDYNILLFNRFKEELSRGLSVDDAIIRSYQTAGKTIVFSIVTVFVAFLSLIFSESEIYKSGVVVVIGASCLLLEIMTLTPFAMKVLGEKLFWPSRKSSGHSESKIWYKASSMATKSPVIWSVGILLFIIPTILFQGHTLSFDNIGELGDGFDSTKGFQIVSDHFGKGQAMPVTIVIKNENTLDNNNSLRVVDEVTEAVKALDGVDKVASATQPEGKPIDGFYVGNDLITVADGLSQTKTGVDSINGGLSLAQSKLAEADFSQVSQMVDGTNQLKNGVSALSDGLAQIKNGMKDNRIDSQSISTGLSTVATNLNAMSAGLKTLSGSYDQMQAGYVTMGENYQSIANFLIQLRSTVFFMQSVVDALGQSYPNAGADVNYLTLKQTIAGMAEGLSSVSPENIEVLNENYNALNAGFGIANENLAQMSDGLAQMSGGLNQLESGLGQAADGIGTIVTNMNAISDGLAQMEEGQQMLSDGLTGFSTFGNSLSQVNDGLSRISDGLDQSNRFVSELSAVKSFYIPGDALKNADYQKALESYLSEDKKITKLMVVLDCDPYSMEAVNTVGEIDGILNSTLDGTTLKNADYGIAGPSATTRDENNVLSQDLNRMIVIVLLGIFLVLLLLIRSMWSSLCITGALIGTYFAAIFLSNQLFSQWLHFAGFNPFIPFFSFIIIVALGVDYSIFLMARVGEYQNLSPKEAIIESCRQTGGVVTGAAIILGGTFATLIPSKMSLLIQLAITVVIGLMILCFVMLPIFIPAMIALPERIRGMRQKSEKE